MNKMVMPIIEVVRFKETDVIVASTYADNFTVANFGSRPNTTPVGKQGDGTITYDGNVYGNGGTGTMDQFLAIIARSGMNSQMTSTMNVTRDISSIIDLEYNTTTLSNGWNGTYIYDGSTFVQQH